MPFPLIPLAIAGVAGWLTSRKGASPAHAGKGHKMTANSDPNWQDLSAPYTITTPTEVRHGGTRAWRNMNPGNLRFQTDGAIGRDSLGFAVFPNKYVGRAALIRHIQSGPNKQRALGFFFERYAPKKDHNDPHAYAQRVASRIGATLDTLMGSLSAAQVEGVATAIEGVEGWKAGTITPR